MGIERALQPLQAVALDQDHVKTARWRAGQAQQVVARRKNNAPPLGSTHTGTRTTKISPRAAAHFGEDQRAIGRAQNQVDLPAATPWRSIIALQQTQARCRQPSQSPLLRSITLGLGAGRARARCGRLRFFKESH